MTSQYDIAVRWAEESHKPNGKRLLGTYRSNNVYPSSDGRDLHSYGSHFTLARIMLDSKGRRSWFLVNGDNYSVSTSRHQSLTRSAVKATGLPYVIIPFTALERAGVIMDSIKPVETLPETYETITNRAASWDEIPKERRPVAKRDGSYASYTEDGSYADVRRAEDGSWYWETSRHWLGSAVFRASYWAERKSGKGPRYSWSHVKRTRYFLSAFDEQEPRPLYFLAELPKDSKPQSYDDAIEALKPADVKLAEMLATRPDGTVNDTGILRQGDVFAIPRMAETRALKRLSAQGIQKRAYVLGVNHTASEVIETRVGTFARGILRHEPTAGLWGLRRPSEHKSVKLGDGKTWYRLVRNTVPDGRSWSLGGRVD